MTKRGFILGKFLPPHAGHIWLCQTAAQLVDELTVLVCTLESEPINGAQRFHWMKTLLPGVRVVHFKKDVPQVPSDHPDFWSIWRNICRDVHPKQIDYVFGSDPYINQLANVLGAAPVILDPDRQAVPTSGTQIRVNPAKYWQFVPPVVRPYFQKRIVLFGPESVGKSTLAQGLADHFETLFVPEYGRTYTEENEIVEWLRSDFITISERHEAMRHSLAQNAGPLLFEDTDPLLTCVWEDMLTGEKSDWVDDVELADLYLWLQLDIDWKDDGTRYFSQKAQQENFANKCRDILEKSGASYAVVSGDGKRRLEAAIAAVNGHFADFIRD